MKRAGYQVSKCTHSRTRTSSYLYNVQAKESDLPLICEGNNDALSVHDLFCWLNIIINIVMYL